MTFRRLSARFARPAVLAVALAGGLGVAAMPTAAAAPADDTRGMPQILDRVLTPADPAFWNPADDGVRVATRIAPRTAVACSSGFQPPISCSLLPAALDQPQRPLSSIDVPRFGAAPIRIWFDTPRWSDGDTWRITERLQTGALS